MQKEEYKSEFINSGKHMCPEQGVHLSWLKNQFSSIRITFSFKEPIIKKQYNQFLLVKQNILFYIVIKHT